jgi:hypothetical protein
MSADEEIACPFVYARGKPCKGHIVRVEAFKADLCWEKTGAGKWEFRVGEPRSHYHLFCSEKGNHAGSRRSDDEGLKFYLSDLPPALLRIISRTD